MAVGLHEINRAPWPCFVSQISFVHYLESHDQQAHASWPSCWTHHETVNDQIFLMSHKGKNKFDFPLNLCVLGDKSAEQMNCCQKMWTHSGYLFIYFFTVYISLTVVSKRNNVSCMCLEFLNAVFAKLMLFVWGCNSVVNLEEHSSGQYS